MSTPSCRNQDGQDKSRIHRMGGPKSSRPYPTSQQNNKLPASIKKRLNYDANDNNDGLWWRSAKKLTISKIPGTHIKPISYLNDLYFYLPKDLYFCLPFTNVWTMILLIPLMAMIRKQEPAWSPTRFFVRLQKCQPLLSEPGLSG